MYNQIIFKGDYSKLKSMGFTFQKLYAGNYMQWSHDDGHQNTIRVWKRGNDMTIDRFQNVDGLLLDYLIYLRESDIPLNVITSSMFKTSAWVRFYHNKETDEFTQDATKYRTEYKANLIEYDKGDAGNPQYKWTEYVTNPEFITSLYAFYDMGWIEPKLEKCND